jgi:hypothetical protein
MVVGGIVLIVKLVQEIKEKNPVDTLNPVGGFQAQLSKAKPGTQTGQQKKASVEQEGAVHGSESIRAVRSVKDGKGGGVAYSISDQQG